MTETKKKPVVTIICSWCQKDLVMDRAYYRLKSGSGQQNFYHNLCSHKNFRFAYRSGKQGEEWKRGT